MLLSMRRRQGKAASDTYHFQGSFDFIADAGSGLYLYALIQSRTVLRKSLGQSLAFRSYFGCFLRTLVIRVAWSIGDGTGKSNRYR